MPTKAVQQFMLGTVLGNENEARQTLAAMKAACRKLYETHYSKQSFEQTLTAAVKDLTANH